MKKKKSNYIIALVVIYFVLVYFFNVISDHVNIKNIGIIICDLSIVGSVRIGAIDKVMIVAIDIKSYRNM